MLKLRKKFQNWRKYQDEKRLSKLPREKWEHLKKIQHWKTNVGEKSKLKKKVEIEKKKVEIR